MLAEEANFVSDLRARALANVREGNPAHTGIDEADLKRAVEILRKGYTANQSKSKAAGVTNAPAAMVDLDSLFTTSSSKK